MQKTAKDIKSEFIAASIEDLEKLIAIYGKDERTTVRKLAISYEKRLKRHRELKARHDSMSSFDAKYGGVVGVDEAGRGPLFGPIYAAACIVEPNNSLIEVYDSKSLSPAKREELYDGILTCARAYGIASVSAGEIDAIGIQAANSKVMKRAIDQVFSKLNCQDAKDFGILADYVSFEIGSYDFIPIKKGDAKSFSIACASILAKVARDRFIAKMAKKYPGYRIEKNMGYGSKEHIDAIKRLGPTDEHRMSFLGGILGE